MPSHPPASSRRSTGPLSARNLSTFRCPSRADFLRGAARPPPPRSKSFAAPGDRSHLPVTASAPSPTRSASSDEDAVPEHLSAAFLDAVDRLDVFPELQAITTWLDDVRATRGFTLRATDIDLSNGVALLDALYVIDASLFADVEYGDASDAGDGEKGVPRPYVDRELDPEGGASRRNVDRLREMLARFEWRDVDGDGRVLAGVDFQTVDVWALAGFVVLAAYVCERREDFLDLMVSYDEPAAGYLEDVIWRGLKALGAGLRSSQGGSASSCTVGTDGSAASIEVERAEAERERWKRKAEEAGRKYEAERKRREDAMRRAEVERKRADREAGGRVRAEKAVERLTRSVEEFRSARGALREVNGECGRGVQALRTENARLRRVVAEFEREKAARERRDREGRRARGAGRVGGGRRAVAGRPPSHG